MWLEGHLVWHLPVAKTPGPALGTTASQRLRSAQAGWEVMRSQRKLAELCISPGQTSSEKMSRFYSDMAAFLRAMSDRSRLRLVPRPQRGRGMRWGMAFMKATKPATAGNAFRSTGSASHVARLQLPQKPASYLGLPGAPSSITVGPVHRRESHGRQQTRAAPAQVHR